MNLQIDFFGDDLVRAIGPGIYEITVCKDGKTACLYIGESVWVMVRCATHLYRLKHHPAYFGFTEETLARPDITLTFRLIESEDDPVRRKSREKAYIARRSPLSQSGRGDHQKPIPEKIRALEEFLKGAQP